MPSDHPAAPGYRAGDVIAGRYRLETPIRRGGMGEVWLAHDQMLALGVALKVLRRERMSTEATKRLLQEARAAARLGHPSIVRVFEFGTSERGDPYLAMELLRGEALDEVLARRGPLPPLGAVQTLLPVASALVAAHAQGIIHRDIKPENIVLTSESNGVILPKLLDFGIAKLREEGVAAHVTQEGLVVGSPAYMSPEQATGAADVDGRADVWSLCVVLYEAIAARRPFDGQNYRALMHAVMMTAPRPLEHDAALWAILARGLEKERDVRWPSVRELGRALATWAHEHGASDDVAGTSLTVHWLGETMPTCPLPSESLRLLGTEDPSTVLNVVSSMRTRPQASPRAKLAVGAALVVCAGIAIAGVAASGRDDPQPVASTILAAAPPPAPAPAPTASTTTESPEPAPSHKPKSSPPTARRAAEPAPRASSEAAPRTAPKPEPQQKPAAGGMPLPEVPTF